MKNRKKLVSVLSIAVAFCLAISSAYAAAPVKLTDGSGNSLSAPRTGGYTASVEGSTDRLITAVYDSNGILSDTFMSDNGSVKVDTPTLDGMTVKNFLWDMNTLVPLQAVQQSGLIALVDSAKSRVRIRWNVFDTIEGVVSYSILRDGNVIATVQGAEKSLYYDYDVTDGGTYTYTVYAKDASGEILAVSNEVTATVEFETAPAEPTYPDKPEADYSSVASYTLDVTKLIYDKNGSIFTAPTESAKDVQTWDAATAADRTFGLAAYANMINYDETQQMWLAYTDIDRLWATVDTDNDGIQDSLFTTKYYKSSDTTKSKNGILNIKFGTKLIPDNGCADLVISFKTKSTSIRKIGYYLCEDSDDGDHTVTNYTAEYVGHSTNDASDKNVFSVTGADADGWRTVTITGKFGRCSSSSDKVIDENVLRIESNGSQLYVKDLSVMTAEEAAKKAAIDAELAEEITAWETEVAALKAEYESELDEYNKITRDDVSDSHASFSVNYDSATGLYTANETKIDEIYDVKDTIGTSYSAVEYTTNAGKPCIKTVSYTGNNSERLTRAAFKVDDTYMYGERDNYAEITVEYYDEGTDAFYLYYQGINGNLYKSHKKTGTNEWKKVTFIIDDANFKNGLNWVAADFHLYQSTTKESPQQLSIASVTVNKHAGQEALRNNPSVHITGTSIARDYSGEDTPHNGGVYGWGEKLNYSSGIRVANRAIAGASTRTYAYFDTTANDVQKGDYVFISFGGNDASNVADRHTTVDEFITNYNNFIDKVFARGGIPVIITTTPNIDDNGNIMDRAADYDEAAIELAKQRGIVYVDLNTLMSAYLEELTVIDRDALYIDDNLHLSESGATVAANLINEALKSDPKINVLKQYIQ